MVLLVTEKTPPGGITGTGEGVEEIGAVSVDTGRRRARVIGDDTCEMGSLLREEIKLVLTGSRELESKTTRQYTCENIGRLRERRKGRRRERNGFVVQANVVHESFNDRGDQALIFDLCAHL